MASKATGSNNITLRVARGGKRNLGGFYREEVYEGTRQSVETAYGFFVGIGAADVFIEHDGPLWRLIVRREDQSPAGFPVQTGTRLQNQRVQKSIFEPPGPNNISDQELRDIQKFIDNPDSDILPEDFLSDDAYYLYSLALRGVTSRPVEQPWLIKTVTQLNTRSFLLSFTNVGRIFSTASVIADAGVANVLRFGLPADVSNRIGFEFGWLKHGAEVEPGPGNLHVATQSYEYGFWSTFLFGDLL